MAPSYSPSPQVLNENIQNLYNKLINGKEYIREELLSSSSKCDTSACTVTVSVALSTFTALGKKTKLIYFGNRNELNADNNLGADYAD